MILSSGIRNRLRRRKIESAWLKFGTRAVVRDDLGSIRWVVWDPKKPGAESGEAFSVQDAKKQIDRLFGGGWKWCDL